MVDGVKEPAEGKLIYRGIDLNDIVEGCLREDRYGFEEVSWLLLFGHLPTREQLDMFSDILAHYRELPENFAEDMIMKAPSPNIMNKLARGILSLYSYDDNPDDNSLENIMRQSMEIIARAPMIMVNAYQVKRRVYDKKSMYFHVPKPYLSTAQNILRTLRANKQFTEEEARLLDLCLILHAEHGGGNNSTFTCRCVTSTGSDTYAALSAAVGSLKGPRHGGANLKVMEMVDTIKENVKDWGSEEELKDFLIKILRKEAGDGSGLIYGIGHAIYTKSDPRAVILKEQARKLAKEKDMMDEMQLFENIERLAPIAFAEVKGDSKSVCANVDFYSGFVYKLLGIPVELYTSLFAISRTAGWCAHRIEECVTSNRIMRPAYMYHSMDNVYIPLSER